MDGLSSEPAPAEEHTEVAKDAKDAKEAESACVEKKKRVVRKKPEKLSSAAAEVPAATRTEAPAVDAKFFGKLGSTLRDLRREAKAQKFSSFVVA
jgi:hypothetical protein